MAERSALFDRHGRVGKLFGQETIVQVVLGASDWIPKGNALLLESDLIEAENGGDRGAGLGRGASGTVRDGVAAGKCWKPAERVFRDATGVDAVLHERVILQLEVAGAVFDPSRLLSALFKRTLESRNVPSVEEIY